MVAHMLPTNPIVKGNLCGKIYRTSENVAKRTLA
jgi:hypothetical protein